MLADDLATAALHVQQFRYQMSPTLSPVPLPYNTIQYNIIFVGNRRHKEVGGRTTLHDRGAGKRKNLRSHRKVDIKKVGFKGAFEREEIVWVRITREGR